MQKIEAVKLLEGFVSKKDLLQFENIFIDGVITDSRKAEENKLFVAIKGERVDGHDYVKQTIDAGVKIALAQHKIADVSMDNLMLISDPLDAMIKMGGNYRDNFDVTLVGVTGSVGKTTTKEFCAAIFEQFGSTVKTQGNQNNEIGMPNTLFNIDKHTKYAVVEMGMQGLGEISKLTNSARPNAAIITNVGTAHLGQLKTRENICKAKLEICEGIKPDGFIVLNGDDDLLLYADIKQDIKRYTFGIKNKNADVTCKNIQSGGLNQTFTILDKDLGEFEAEIPAVGEHNISNALSAYTLATRLGLDPAKVVEGLKNYQTTGFRQNFVQNKSLTIIEDCYNANYDSMLASIKMLSNIDDSKRKIVVLGDMLDLGASSEDLHLKIGENTGFYGIDIVITYGDKAQYIEKGASLSGVGYTMHFTDKTEVVKELTSIIKKDDVLLFKASRGMKLEDIIYDFYREIENNKEI